MILQTHRLRDAILLALAASTTLAGTGVAFAQDQDQEATPVTTTLDRIEVTGSRLKRAEIEGAMQVTIIDRAQIDASCEVSVADYLHTNNFNSVGQLDRKCTRLNSSHYCAYTRPSSAGNKKQVK